MLLIFCQVGASSAKNPSDATLPNRARIIVARWMCLLTILAIVVGIPMVNRGKGPAVAEQTARAEVPGPPPPAIIDAARYPTLQAALDALPETGGVVHLPPGVFRLEKPLVLSRGNTRLQGSGPATCLINCMTGGQPTLIVRPANLEQNPRVHLWRVEIAHLRLQGDPQAVDGKGSESVSGDGILAQNINEILIEAVGIDHHGGNGINLINCYEDPRIINCILTYNRKAGLNIEGGHDIVVSSNQFEENQLAIRCVDSFNLCMTGNNIDDHLGDGVIIENTYGSVLTGNMIEECQGAAVILDRDCYGITVSANVLAHNFGGGVKLLDAWGCAISANTFTLNGQDGLFVGPSSGRLTITGNHFCDSFIGETTRRSGDQNFAGGIQVQDACDVVICGNQFSGLDGPAVAATSGAARICVTGNIIRDVNRRAPQPTGAIALEGASDCRISDNILAPEASTPLPP